MQKMRTAAMVAALSIATLWSSVTANAQAAGTPSGITKTKGLMFGLHLHGTSISNEDEDNGSSKKERASGGGLGAQVGWGFTKWLMVYAGADAAQVTLDNVTGVDDDDVEPDYTFIHGDLGVRFSFPSPNHGFVPYLNAALSARVATAEVLNEDVSISGNGLTLGGGLQYFFTPKWALDVGAQFTAGKFTEVEAGGVKLDLDELGIDVKNTNSARVNVGMKFYPHFGKK
jgi:opacity protein-like surface antigen